MWALLVLIGWVLLEVIMARLAGDAGPEFHSITTLQLNTPAGEDHEQWPTANGRRPRADS